MSFPYFSFLHVYNHLVFVQEIKTQHLPCFSPCWIAERTQPLASKKLRSHQAPASQFHESTLRRFPQATMFFTFHFSHWNVFNILPSKNLAQSFKSSHITHHCYNMLPETSGTVQLCGPGSLLKLSQPLPPFHTLCSGQRNCYSDYCSWRVSQEELYQVERTSSFQATLTYPPT